MFVCPLYACHMSKCRRSVFGYQKGWFFVKFHRPYLTSLLPLFQESLGYCQRGTRAKVSFVFLLKFFNMSPVPSCLDAFPFPEDMKLG